MPNRSSRLVPRVQWQLQSADVAEEASSLCPRDVAELKARVAQLQEYGRAFWEVGLSRYVTRGGVAGASGRTGGVYVATDA